DAGLPLARDAPPQDALDPGDELPRRKRLRQVVVGTELQTLDLVFLEAARGEHDDRQVGLLPDLLQDAEAVAPRKREVEDDEVRPVGVDHRQRFVAVGRLDRGHILAREGERAPYERSDVRLVVDDQDLRHCAASGSEVTNAAPPPGFSSYTSVPP